MVKIILTKKDISFFQNRILKAGKELYSYYPWRNTKNRFHALTAEILLQRTNADQVLPVYTDFTRKYQTPEQYLSSQENIFNNLGLNWRNDIFIQLCYELKKTNKIPSNKNELLKLPGVGEYIASAFLSLHLNRREAIIDSNIVRLYGRYFGFKTDGETRRKRWFIELANELTPDKRFKKYNYGLLDFTRIICKRRPNCPSCILNINCIYYC